MFDSNWMYTSCGRNPLKGMLSGMLAGAAASWMMSQFPQMRPQPEPRAGTGQTGSERQPHELEPRRQSDQDEQASVKTAEFISRRVLHHDLTEREKQIAGPAVHYAYGTLLGGVYGALAELVPSIGAGFGMPFGAASWLAGDEVALPALGLGKKPTETELETHLDSLSAHFCYGVTTDLLRRVLRHVL